MEPHQDIRTSCHPILGKCLPITLINYLLQIPNYVILSPNFDLLHRFPSGFPRRILFALLPFPIYATCPAHRKLRDLSVLIISAFPQILWISTLCNFLHSPISSSLFGRNIILSILFSNTRNFFSSLKSERDHVSHPYRTGRIMVLYVLSLIF